MFNVMDHYKNDININIWEGLRMIEEDIIKLEKLRIQFKEMLNDDDYSIEYMYKFLFDKTSMSQFIIERSSILTFCIIVLNLVCHII